MFIRVGKMSKSEIRKKKKWYKKNKPKMYFRMKITRKIKKLKSIKKLPLFIDLFRWLYVDLLTGKLFEDRNWGLYCFVGQKGQGKTTSMVAHILRAKEKIPKVEYYTNFSIDGETGSIIHWTDILRFVKDCSEREVPCIIAFDEIHVSFDASGRDFPVELKALLAYLRKLNVQFLTSVQAFEDFPSPLRRQLEYVVISENFWNLDRLYISHYFQKSSYEKKFTGKRKRADFTKLFVAGDDIYDMFNTNKVIDRLVKSADEEKQLKNNTEIFFKTA